MKPGILGWLSRTPVIIGFLIVTVLISGGFYFVLQAIDGAMLDTLWTGEDAITRLNEMSEPQRRAHFLGTVILDVMFPLAYGGFFIGLLSRLAWSWRWCLILVPIVAVLADFAENTVQAMALKGYPAEILLAKNVVTPVKFGSLGLALALCILLGAAALVRRQTHKKEPVDD